MVLRRLAPRYVVRHTAMPGVRHFLLSLFAMLLRGSESGSKWLVPRQYGQTVPLRPIVAPHGRTGMVVVLTARRAWTAKQFRLA
jgi:hypothetical protein